MTHNLFYLISPLVGVVISLPLAFFVLRRDPRSAINRLFCLELACIGLWGLFIFAMRSSPDVERAFIWHKLVFVAGSAIFVIYYHFTVVYLKSLNRILVFLAYLFLAAVAFLSFTGLLTSGISVESYGYAPHFYPTIYFVSVGGAVFLIMALIGLIRAQIASTQWLEKNRLMYMIVGIIMVLVFGVVDFIPNLPPVGIFGNILFGLLTGVAILRYHLLDINIVIRKSVAYLLTSTVVAIPIVGTIILFNALVGPGRFTVWLYLGMLLVIAIGLQAVWLRIQNFVDRLFFRERYDFLRELERFGSEVHDISDIGKLGLTLVGLIGQALQTSSVQLFVVDDSSNFNLIASTSKDKQKIVFQNNSPLVRWLGRTKEILFRHQMDVTPQLQSLTSRERASLASMGAELFISLKTNKDELVGMLILGKKRSEQPYSGEDTRRILTVSNRVAIELENARLYARESSIRMEMQRQNEQKTEFLHHVAHELKTPLTAIISSSELFTSEGLTINPEQKERLLANINRSAWLMDKRVGELLDLARIQIGTLELKLEPVDMGEMVRDLTSQLSALFKNKEQTISIDIPDSLPKVKADKERVEEIVINLLSNANKFSPARGSILIRASTMRNKVSLEVKDSASLISDEDRIRIFTAYYRGGSAEDRQRISGLGLGLAISKSLIELHHGEIGVKNEDSHGNIFYFSLPIWGIGEEKQSDDASALSREGV